MKKNTINGILTCIGAFCFHLSLGYYYTTGNMNPYLIAYMKITSGKSIWVNSAMLAVQSASMPIGGILQSKFGFRVPMIIGMVMSCGILLTRLTVNHSFGLFILTYSVMFGCAAGLPYSVIFSVAATWFPKQRATIVGIIAAGFGLGALVFTPIQTALINPNNQHDFTHEDVTSRVANSFLVFGGIIVALQVIGLILIRERKPDEVEEDDDDMNPMSFEESQIDIKQSQMYEESKVWDEEDIKFPIVSGVPDATVGEAARNPDFYIILLIMFVGGIAVTLLSSTYKTFGKEYVSDDQYLTAIATMSSAFNCVGRLLWGIVCDKVSYKIPIIIIMCMWTITFSSFPFIGLSGKFRELYPIWVALLYMFLAGHYVTLPAATSNIFGLKNMSTLYGLIFLSNAPGTILVAAITSQFSLDGQFVPVYLACAGLSFTALILVLFLKDSNARGGDPAAICSRICNPCRRIPTARIDPDLDIDVDVNVDIDVDDKI